MSKPRKPIADLIGELRSWLPNYDHGPEDYPTLLWRILASIPGGDEAVDMGYEPFSLGWQEVSQLGKVLEAIQDKRDVGDLIRGLIAEEEEDVEERRRPHMREERRRFTTRRDLANDIAERLNLDASAVYAAIPAHYKLFNRYEDITPAQLDTLDRAVFRDVSGGAAWPFGRDVREPRNVMVRQPRHPMPPPGARVAEGRRPAKSTRRRSR